MISLFPLLALCCLIFVLSASTALGNQDKCNTPTTVPASDAPKVTPIVTPITPGTDAPKSTPKVTVEKEATSPPSSEAPTTDKPTTPTFTFKTVGDNYAATSVVGQGDKMVTLWTNPKAGQTSNTQFLYTRPSEKLPLAKVSLINAAGAEVFVLYAAGFDIFTQKCSCYWIDVADIWKKKPSLAANAHYRLRMEGEGYKVDSGVIKVASHA